MGVIQIRSAQEKLQNLGNVRMVDTSGLAKSSAAGLENLGKSVAGIGRDIVSGMNSINALIERDHERQANKAVEQFRQELDHATTFAGEFVSGADGKTTRTGEGLFVRVAESEDEAAKFNVNMKAAIDKAYEGIKYSEMNKDVRRRFDEKTFGYIQGKWNEGNRLATARWEKSSIEHADAGLKNAIYDVVQDQSVANVRALENALQSACDANHWSDETFAMEKRKTMQAVALGAANKAIAEATDVASLDNLTHALSSIGGKARTDHKQTLYAVFGDINPNVLPSEQRVALQDAIRRKRTLVAQKQDEIIKQQNNVTLNDYHSGKITFDNAAAKIELRNTSAATREATLNALSRERERKATEEVMPVWLEVSAAAAGKTPSETLAMLDASLTSDAKASSYYATFRKMAEKGLVEVYEKDRERTAGTLIEQIVDDLSLSEEEANARLDQDVFGVYGEIYGGESGVSKMDKIKKRVHAARQTNVAGYRSYVGGLLGNREQRALARVGYTFGQGQSLREGVPVVYDSDGNINVNATYKDMESAAFGWESDAVNTDFADFEPAIKSALNVLRSADARVQQLAAEHPDWTTKQLTDIFNELVPQDVMNTLLIQEYSSQFDSAAVIEAMTTFESDTMGLQDYNAVLGAATAAGDEAEPKKQPSERDRSMDYKNKNLNSL